MPKSRSRRMLIGSALVVVLVLIGLFVAVVALVFYVGWKADRGQRLAEGPGSPGYPVSYDELADDEAMRQPILRAARPPAEDTSADLVFAPVPR